MVKRAYKLISVCILVALIFTNFMPVLADDAVLIPDKYLEMTIRDELGIDESVEITKDLLKELTFLSIGPQVENLEGLQFAENLYYLSIYAPKLTSLPENIFSNMKQLDTLYLEKVAIGNYYGVFSELTSLTSLSIFDTRLENVTGDMFEGLSSLVSLQFICPNLKSIEAGAFEDLDSLMYLTFAFTAIEELPANVFKGLDNLLSLYFYSNIKLRNINEKTFSGLSQLRDLTINSSILEEIPAGALDDLTSFEYLYLSNNRLKKLPAGLLNNNEQIEVIYLDNNKLTELDPGLFSNLSNLKYLSLNYNKLNSLPEGIFDNLINLKEMNLSYNPIESFPDKLLDNCSSLVRLYLENMNLTEIPAFVGNIPSLEHLYLSRNKISQIDPDIFEKLKNLCYLYLAENYITSIPEGTFDKWLANIKEKHDLPENLYNDFIVDLSDNLITDGEGSYIHWLIHEPPSFDYVIFNVVSYSELSYATFTDVTASRGKLWRFITYYNMDLDVLEWAINSYEEIFDKNSRILFEMLFWLELPYVNFYEMEEIIPAEIFDKNFDDVLDYFHEKYGFSPFADFLERDPSEYTREEILQVLEELLKESGYLGEDESISSYMDFYRIVKPGFWHNL